MLQVGVEEVLQVVVLAEGDEQAVEVEAKRGAVLRDRWGRGHHSSTLSKSPQQLLQVLQFVRDEHTSPGHTARHHNVRAPFVTPQTIKLRLYLASRSRMFSLI